MAELQMEDIEDVGLQNTNPVLRQIIQNMNDELAARGYTMTVTGGARSPEHNAEVNGVPNSLHLTGNAVDLDANVPDGLLEELAEKHGLDYLWHDAGTGMHFHVEMDGEPQEPIEPKSGSIMDMVASTSGFGGAAGVLPEHDELPEDQIDYASLPSKKPAEKIGFMNALVTNFWDSFTTTGTASVVKSLYYSIFENPTSIFRPISQDDIEFVKAALPDDKESQEFCLLHGQNAEEVRYLVNQRLNEKKRLAEIEQWRRDEESKMKVAASYVTGAVGTLLDPVMWLPQMEALTGMKMLGKLGKAIQNVPKARQIANAAAKVLLTGTEQTAIQMLDDGMRARFGGQRVDYGTSAAFAFLGGAGLRALRMKRWGKAADSIDTAVEASLDKLETDALKSVVMLPEKTAPVGLRRTLGRRTYRRVEAAIAKETARKDSDLAKIAEQYGTTDPMTILREAAHANKVPKNILRKLQSHEHIRAKAEGRTPVIQSLDDAAEWLKKQDLPSVTEIPVGEVGSETYRFASLLHDAKLAVAFKSPILERLGKTGRVVVTTAENASQLVEKMSGRKIPETAKAFYVPNEDYAILLADRVKPEEVNGVLAHEFAVHGGLKKTLGEQTYEELLQRIHKQANNPKTSIFKMRREAGTHDPEEILAYMIEHDKLPSNLMEIMRGLFNKAHKADGISFTKEDVKKILSQQLDAERAAATGIHFNEDGSTAFAGLQFSKDSLFNANLWNDLFSLEGDVVKMTQQGWLLEHVPNFMKPYAGRFTKLFEQGYFGTAFTSASNTMRSLAGQLWEDARGRGAFRLNAMAAETHKEMLKKQLYRGIFQYIDARAEAIGQMAGRFSRAKALAFDQEVYRYYNAHYAGNIAGGLMEDAPDGVKKAAAILDEYRKTQIQLGKNSSRMVGSKYGSLVEDAWEPVDAELWRHIDKDAQTTLLSHANNPEELAALHAQLVEYARRFAKRDVIRQQLEREGQLAAERIRARGETAVPVPVTDDLIEEVIERDAQEWAKKCMDISGSHDLQAAENVTGELGNLPFFRKRLALDTSGIMEFDVGGNRFEFSFDNNLRDFDLTKIMQQNAERFAGDAAVKAVFGSDGNMRRTLAGVQHELSTAAATGNGVKNWKAEYQTLVDGINELRGMRPPDDIMTRSRAFWRFFQNLSYAKNGANMGWAQLGEAGGAMAYGGVKRVFDAFPPIRRFMNDLEYGKITAETLRETEDMMFARSQESRIYGTSYGDRAVREQLTSGSLIDRALIGANDFTANLGKITSTVNMLPKMTEEMVKGMRAQTLADCIRWAEGKKFSKWRNPFSEAKMRAARLTKENQTLIREHINKYVSKDAGGNLLDIDVKAWQAENPVTYAQLWNLIQNQAERAIISGSRSGNRNLLKNMNSFTRMLFQFKDYNLRAINAQTLRAFTAGDVDDAVAAGMSIVTNLASYGARCAATYQVMKAAGLTDKAEKYKERMFSDEQLFRVAAVRSAILGTFPSFANDTAEMLRPDWGTVRTTVNGRYQKGSADMPLDVGDMVGNAITQLPAIKEATVLPLQAIQAVQNAGGDRATQRDVVNGLRLLPIPQLIGVDAFYKAIAEQSGLPERRSKSKTSKKYRRK